MRTLRKEVLAGYKRALVARLFALQSAQTSDRAVLESKNDSECSEFTSAALHNSEEAVSATLVTVRGSEIQRVKYALERVGDGTYGICEMCGQLIPLARLDAVPAIRCLHCQEKVEQKQGIWPILPRTRPR